MHIWRADEGEDLARALARAWDKVQTLSIPQSK